MTAAAARPGGLFLTVDRGMFEQEPAKSFEVSPATAPLFEIAALHDGQNPVAWLGYLKAQFEG